MNWQPVTVPLSSLTPWERNPKRISKAHARRLLDLWGRLGQFQTIAIGPGGEVYDGHQRLSVLKTAYGADYEVKALQSDRPLTEDERAELTISAHSGTVGTWDWDALSGWDAGQLQGWGFDAETLGDWRAGVAALDAMLAADKEQPEDPGAQIDRAEELRALWGVESGQLWALGEHRIVCGDCTDRAVVERVMGGERAQVLFTSPPYWVGFEYEQENTWSQVLSFISLFCLTYADQVNQDGRIIINTGTVQAGDLTGQKAHMRLLIDIWANALEIQGWLMRYVRFWVKDGGLLHTAPQSDCIDQHTEFIGYFYNSKAKFRGQERTGTPWAGKGYWDDIPGAARESGHIAAFPVELPERNVLLFSRSGEVVLDPFLGSGTTLIACERLGRRCRGIEISPAYVAVAIQRWVDTTGGAPVLLDSVQT